MGFRASRVARMPVVVRRTVIWFRRYVLPTDSFRLAILSLIVVAAGMLCVVRPDLVSPAAMTPWIVVGGIFLSFRSILLLVLVVGLMLAYDVASLGLMASRPGSIVVVAATCFLALWLGRSRARLGVYGTRGESMLVDLRSG
jgi:hypothetical protein